MKKLYLVLVSLFLVLGCSKDNDPILGDNPVEVDFRAPAVKVQICHATKGKKGPYFLKELPENKVQDHLDHGDEYPESCIGDGVFLSDSCKVKYVSLDGEICDDGIDNDCDGLVDCEDPDCHETEICNPCPENKHSLKFNGGYVAISPSLNFPSNSTGVTMSIMVKDEFNPGTRERLFGINHTTDINNLNRYTITKDYGRIQFLFEGLNITPYVTSGSQILYYNYNQPDIQNKWISIIATVDKSMIKIYLDGALVASSSYIGSPIHAMYPSIYKAIGISANLYAFPTDAFIDNVGLWNVALDGEFIADNYDCLPAGNEDNLVAFWRFDEGIGTTTSDESSNGFDGTLIGPVSWSTDIP